MWNKLGTLDGDSSSSEVHFLRKNSNDKIIIKVFIFKTLRNQEK